MVSANGGSWSNIKADQNNSIKVFFHVYRHLNLPKEI
jgi:hypothetical protein